jgi:uncharacterized protein (TIGR00299 family) protein
VTRIAYLDCAGGLAGDMLLGALLDAGAPQEALHDIVRALPYTEVKVEVEPVHRHGIAATHVRVIADAPTPDRRAGELLESVASADLAPPIRDRSLGALRRLTAAESKIHGVPEHELVLHEAGGADTLVDVVGTFALLDALAVDHVVCSPIPYARGQIDTAHGSIPGPGPAVLALLDGVPVFGVEAEAELVTPTGAAIAAGSAASFGELPPLVLEGVGYGAGSRDLRSRANLLRVVLGTSSAPIPVADVVLLEANLDDLLPELVPDAIEACRGAGALDVWTTPVHMKKGRPGVLLSAVARPDAERPVADALLVHSSTLGVRATALRRYELERESREVRVQGHPIRVKVGILHGRVVNAAPEHDDCADVAAATGMPVKRVWASAFSAAQAFTQVDHDVDR